MGWGCGTYGGQKCTQVCGEDAQMKKKKTIWKSYRVTSSRRCDRHVVPSSSRESHLSCGHLKTIEFLVLIIELTNTSSSGFEVVYWEFHCNFLIRFSLVEQTRTLQWHLPLTDLHSSRTDSKLGIWIQYADCTFALLSHLLHHLTDFHETW